MEPTDFPAILCHGERGTGLWQGLLQASGRLLCEAAAGPLEPWRRLPCGECPGCRLWRSGNHPDLRLVVPAALAADLGVEQGALPPNAQAAPAQARGGGREIAIDQVRALIDWAQATSHRGGVKVALVHPLDAMAAPAANALLKLLEEPAPGLWLLAGSYRLDRVLPTVRSRCLLRAWKRPSPKEALAELQRQGLAEAQAVASWSRQAVFDADPARGLQWARKLIEQLAAGGLPQPDSIELPVAIEALQKISLDMLRCRAGLDPLYLPGLDEPLRRLGGQGDSGGWQRWITRLAQASASRAIALHGPLALQAWVVEWSQLCTTGAN